MTFVSARASMHKIVIYRDEHGDEIVRAGGSRAWRNFNPGNIEKGSFAEEYGSIGADSRFAIFPNEATGREAVVALLGSPAYRDLSLAAAINRYAPPSENNTAGYVAFVAAETGLQTLVILGTLKIARLRSITAAIKKIEGWVKGEEYRNKPFSLADAGLVAPVSSAAVAADDWMQLALTEASRPEHERSEWPDPGENPRILEYFRIASPWFDAKAQGGDEVDWCAAFVNYCLETAGYAGTGHPGARSFFWNRHNHFLTLSEPRPGCIAVFRDAPFDDPNWQTGSGHVGFVVDWADGRIELLGGNQDKTVKRQWFQRQYGSFNDVTRRIVSFVIPAMN